MSTHGLSPQYLCSRGDFVGGTRWGIVISPKHGQGLCTQSHHCGQPQNGVRSGRLYGHQEALTFSPSTIDWMCFAVGNGKSGLPRRGKDVMKHKNKREKMWPLSSQGKSLFESLHEEPERTQVLITTTFLDNGLERCLPSGSKRRGQTTTFWQNCSTRIMACFLRLRQKHGWHGRLG